MCTRYQAPNTFIRLYNGPTKEDQFLLGIQTCLGPLRLVTKLFGTQMTFFFEPTIGVPTNLAFTPLTPLVSK